MTEVDRKVQEAAATAEESAAASEEMSKQAQEMKEIVDELIRIVGSGRLQTGSILPARFSAAGAKPYKRNTRGVTGERGKAARMIPDRKPGIVRPELLLADGDDF